MGITPSIAECDGDYNHDSRKNQLLWNLPVIDASSKQGSMEFSVPSSIPGDFFPLDVSATLCWRLPIHLMIFFWFVLNPGYILVKDSLC